MRLYQQILSNLKEHFERIDAQLDLVSYIDRSILKPEASLEAVLYSICARLKNTVDADQVIMVVPTEDGFLPMDNRSDLQELALILSREKSRLLSMRPSEHYVLTNLSDNLNSLLCLPIVAEEAIFALLLIGFASERKNSVHFSETLSFSQIVTSQMGIMIDWFLRRRTSELNSGLVKLFFDSKLKPSACWRQIVEQVSIFLPSWSPLCIDPNPRVQLLSYNEGDKHLRIIGTQGEEMLGTELLVDSSICGFLIEDRSLSHILVNPRDFPNRYKKFLLAEEDSIPQSELAVSIRNGERIIGVLNLEHTQLRVFQSQHVDAMIRVSSFLAPFLDSLRERYERQRSKELGILYTMNHLLTRLASTYQHLLGQPLLNIRLTMEDLEAEMYEKCPESLPILRSIGVEIDRIHASSDRFCEGLPRFIRYGPTNPLKAIKNAISVFNTARLEQEENISFYIDAPAQVEEVYASELLQEHIHNLVNNSLYAVRKALSKGLIDQGTIRIGIEEVVVRDMLNQTTGSRLVRFSISDNGTGVPQEVVDKIGHPGFTTKGDFGTGYGLSAAVVYVQSVGGNFRWDNFSGKGFLVEFLLEHFDESKHKERSETDACAAKSADH